MKIMQAGLSRLPGYSSSALAIVLGASAWQPASAQAAPSAETASTVAPAPDTSGSTSNGDIIVTAQRREQRLIDVPLSVQAQTGAQLAKAGVVDGRGLEQISPAVSFESGYSAQTTSLSMRGVVSIGNEGGIQPSVGVVVDGMPVARQGEVNLDLSDIDRVEILSGPQGTLFGKNSTAGVVNIITKRPTGQYDAGFDLTGTSDKEVIAKAFVNAPINSIFKVRVNGFYRYLDPLVRNYAGPDEYGKRAYGVQGKILADFGATNFLLSGSYVHDFNTMGVQLPTQPIVGLEAQQTAINPFIGFGGPKIIQNPPTFSRIDQHAIVGELNSALSDHLKLTSITGYREYRYSDDVDVDVGPTGGNIGEPLAPNPTNYPVSWFGYLDNHEGGKYRYYSQEVRLAYTSSRLDVIVGGYYQHYRESRYLRNPFIFDGAFATGVPALAGVPFFNSTNLTSRLSDDTAAAFADATYSVLSTVKLFGGLRYTHEKLGLDYHKDIFFNPAALFDPITGIDAAPPIAQLDTDSSDTSRKTNNLSGRAGIQWQPSRNLNYYFSYSRGYKGPAANQGTGLDSADNAIIKPEIASSFELGAKQRLFDGALDLEVALYHMKIRNIQQSSVIPGTVSVGLINAGALKTDGFEVNATARPVEGLVLTSGVVYNNARYKGTAFFGCGPASIEAGTCGNDPAPGIQSLDGKRSIANPRWKVVGAADYTVPVTDDWKLDFNAAVNWRSSIQWQLLEDETTLGHARAIVDLSVGMINSVSRFSATLFVKNLTDKFYYANLNSVSVIGRQYGNLPRDFSRYGGIRLNYHM